MGRRLIDGTRIVVTGASGGIGKEIVKQILRRGGMALAVARQEARLLELAEHVRENRDFSGSLEILAGDVTDPAIRRRIVETAQQKFRGIDGLINNAGVAAFGRFDEGDADRLRQVMEVNFFATAEMIRECLPALRDGRRPFVVNMGSILGHRAIPRMNEYCASKFAVNGLSESLRVEFKKIGVELIVISPGSTDTDFYDHVVHGRGDAPWKQGYTVSAEDVAHATVKAIERGRREVFPNVVGRLLVWANKWAPGIIDRRMSRYA